MTAHPNKLLGLDAIRGAAALYVFIHHAQLLPNQGIGRVLYFGQEAVILFFLLSGFVICYSSSRQQADWKRYLLNRAKRIFPIFLVALVLAYCSQSLIEGRWLGLENIQLLGNIFQLQDVSALKRGVWFDTYYGNSPLWSLSYEWWFYVLFIPLGLNEKFISHNKSVFSALTISVLGFLAYQYLPNQLSLFAGYFFIWWAGVELAKEYIKVGRVSFSGQKNMLFGVTLMTILWALPVAIQIFQHKSLQLGIDPVLQFRHHLAALVFVTVGLFLLQIRGGGGGYEWLSWIMRPFVGLAPISYAIYVTHQPLLNVAHHLGASYPKWLCALIVFPILLLLGWLLEVRMQSGVNRLFSGINFETNRLRHG